MRKSFYYLIMLITLTNLYSQKKKQFTLDDAMKFKAVRGSIISDNGKWIAFEAYPDRGDGEVQVLSTEDSTKHQIERGSKAVFANNSSWAASMVLGKSLEIENAKTPKDKPKNGLSILNLLSGKKVDVENVSNFKFANDSKWLAYLKTKNEDLKSEKFKKKELGSELVIRHLNSGTEIRIDFVTDYQIDSLSKFIFYTISSQDGKRDGIYIRELSVEFAPELKINNQDNKVFANITWNSKKEILAYTINDINSEGKPSNGSLLLWDNNNRDLKNIIISNSQVPDSTWFIPAKNELKWTEDGKLLYFGFKPLSEKDSIDTEDIKLTKDTFYNQDSITSKSDAQIWNYNDSRIRSHQLLWLKDNKDRVYKAVYNLETQKYIQLASLNFPDVDYSPNSNYTISEHNTPYLKDQTWYGDLYDLYLVDLKNGSHKKIAEKLEEPSYLSPKGEYIVYFKNKHWNIYYIKIDSTYNLTKNSKVKFYDEEHDTPNSIPSYGFGGWYDDDYGFISYDKYDVWFFSVRDIGTRINLSGVNGRENNITYRVINLNTEKKTFKLKDTLNVHAFNRTSKVTNISYIVTDLMGTRTVTDDSTKNLRLIAKARNANKYIYSKESFDEFPDLWVADFYFTDRKKISDVNPQMKDFLWGKTELVSWVNSKNDTLQGYLIKPDNYDSKKKYPLLTYFYEKFSNETNRFYQPRMGHRPIYQYYLSEGYVCFVPDVNYTIGIPGPSAVDCITSGVKKVIDMGIADPKKLCLQGHSWAAYQISYIVTQTNMFAAASVGAPVGNMTSAYDQIRPGTGLARQFQYEAQQSRIGGNLWDSLSSYLKNSPVFQAQGTNTPLLVLHGDNDDAVPFAQGVEIYLAWRRLGKNCILVQYNNELHAPRKFENKLDWQIKMKDFFDYYLLGKSEKNWMKPNHKQKGDL